MRKWRSAPRLSDQGLYMVMPSTWVLAPVDLAPQLRDRSVDLTCAITLRYSWRVLCGLPNENANQPQTICETFCFAVALRWRAAANGVLLRPRLSTALAG